MRLESRKNKGESVAEAPRDARAAAFSAGTVCFNEFPMSYFAASLWAVSSAVEHCFHTAGVTGSIPVPPTKDTLDSVAAILLAALNALAAMVRLGLTAPLRGMNDASTT